MIVTFDNLICSKTKRPLEVEVPLQPEGHEDAYYKSEKDYLEKMLPIKRAAWESGKRMKKGLEKI